MKKSRKTKWSKFDEFIMQVDVERFGYYNLLQDFKFVKSVVKIAMDVSWKSSRKESGYKKKDSQQYIYLYLSIYL